MPSQPAATLDEALLMEIMSTCRAMRRLGTDDVPDGMLRRLVECASYAPSGRNLQRGRWIVAAIKRCASASWTCIGEQAKSWRERRSEHASVCPIMTRTGSAGCGAPSCGSPSTCTKCRC